MGSWGSEVFQNDVALDLVGDVVDFVADLIERDLDDMETEPGRNTLVRPILAGVAILSVVLAGIRSARHCLETSRVSVWRDRYLGWFDAVFVGVAAPDVANAHREVAVREFGQLLALAHEDE